MIYVIGDTQSKVGVENPLIAIAFHICDIKPKLAIHLGDHWDFPSLSYYDKGKKSHRVHSYKQDVDAGNLAMAEFWMIIEERWPSYRTECTWHILEGNHENRRNRAMEYCEDKDLEYYTDNQPDYTNWSHVHEFLKIVKLQGINFSHYFQNLKSDTAIPTARQLCLKKHVSSIAGHAQGFDYEEMMTDEKVIQCMIIGSSYYHDEAYKKQSNHHWRGTVLLYNLDGSGGYDFSRWSMQYLKDSIPN
jgi:hypothetical protein